MPPASSRSPQAPPVLAIPRASPAWAVLVITGIFLLPAFFLVHLAGDVLVEEERLLQARVEKALLAEMRELQTRISPGKRLANALDLALMGLGLQSPRADRPLSFSRSASSRPARRARKPEAGAASEAARRTARPQRHGPASLLAESPKAFLPHCRTQLAKTIPARPIVLWVVGPDGEEVAADFDPRFFGAGKSPPETALKQLAASWFGLLDRRPWNPGSRLAAWQARWAGDKGRAEFRAQVQRFGSHLFGDYVPAGDDLTEPRSFFSSRFGPGKVWILGRPLTAGASSTAPLAGGLVVLYRDVDLPLTFLLDPATTSSSGYFQAPQAPPRWGIPDDPATGPSSTEPSSATGAGRLSPPTSEAPVPRFRKSADRFFFEVPLGTEFLRPAETASGTPILQVWRPLADLEHPFRHRLGLAGIGLAFWLIGGTGLLWGLLRGRWNLPLSIRGQLALAMGLAVLPPAVACGIVAQSFLRIWQEEGERACQARLAQRVALLESGLNDFAVGLRERVWAAKERLGPLSGSGSAGLPAALDGFMALGQAQLSHLLRPDGTEIFRQRSLPGVPPIMPKARDRMVESARVLAIGLFREYNRGTIFDGTLASAPTTWTTMAAEVSRTLWRDDEFAQFLGRDPINLDARTTGFRDGRVQGYMLWNRGGRGDMPLAGVVFMAQRLEAIGARYFRRIMSADWDFRRHDPEYEVTTGIFRYSRTATTGEIQLDRERCWPPSSRQDHRLVELAHQAAAHPSGEAHSLVGGREGTCQVFRVFRDFPFLAVAVAEPRNATPGPLRTWAVIGATLAYLLLLLGLASRYLQRVFLAPIDELIRGSGAVSAGDYAPVLAMPETFEFAQLGQEFGTMCKGLREGRLLSRFVSQDAVRDVQETVSTGFDPGGERRLVAILFSHLAGFPEWAGTLPPSQLLDQLNQYFSAMEPAVRGQDGSIDKFIGDAVMAVFHQVPGRDHPVVRALRAGREMRHALEDLNLARQALGLAPFRSGIGIAAGEVLSGRIGSRLRRLDFTVIGDAVNLAARLEARRDQAGPTEIILDAQTAGHLEGDVPRRPLGTLPIKGKARPVELLAFDPEEIR